MTAHLTFGSLFSGIGGFDLGFEQAGMECRWQVEKDKDCNRVLSKQFPKVQRFDDVTTVREFEPVDVICGGFPCQDLSVAGKREGLAGERSGLWFEFHRIIESVKARWVVIENVPGLLSSNDGRDFAVVLRGLVECGYGVSYRILDAQYFGVAQRRRRVFIVGSLGDGSSAEILFESEGVSGDSPPRREARTGTTNVSVRRAQTSSNGWGIRTDGSTGTLDGTGRGTPLVVASSPVFTIQHAQVGRKDDAGPQGKGWQEDVAFTQDSRPTSDIVAFSSKDSGADAGEISPTLRSMNFDKSHINGGGQVAVAFGWNKSESQTMRVDGETTDALQASSTSNPAIAFHENKSGQLSEADVVGLRAGASHSYQGVGGSFGVRRLTPTECEFLQGFPRDWTATDGEGKAISDSARYRMLGNAVAVPCAKWIGQRIVDYDKGETHVS